MLARETFDLPRGYGAKERYKMNRKIDSGEMDMGMQEELKSKAEKEKNKMMGEAQKKTQGTEGEARETGENVQEKMGEAGQKMKEKMKR